MSDSSDSEPEVVSNTISRQEMALEIGKLQAFHANLALKEKEKRQKVHQRNVSQKTAVVLPTIDAEELEKFDDEIRQQQEQDAEQEEEELKKQTIDIQKRASQKITSKVVDGFNVVPLSNLDEKAKVSEDIVAWKLRRASKHKRVDARHAINMGGRRSGRIVKFSCA